MVDADVTILARADEESGAGIVLVFVVPLLKFELWQAVALRRRMDPRAVHDRVPRVFFPEAIINRSRL